jgi:hypothetical protein
VRAPAAGPAVVVRRRCDYVDDVEGDAQVRATAARFGGIVRGFVRNGPAGGNPNYAIDFTDRETAKAFLMELHGEGDPSVTDFDAVY